MGREMTGRDAIPGHLDGWKLLESCDYGSNYI
jgi:hypothetical protein